MLNKNTYAALIPTINGVGTLYVEHEDGGVALTASHPNALFRLIGFLFLVVLLEVGAEEQIQQRA